MDVFAYGMVLYELLSQRSPFDNVHPQLKRNHEVRDGQRPTLQAKETRTLIQLQDLMKLCWDQEPEHRPKMSLAVEWIQATEFERLRAEISLSEVKSISCACVCRILPEYEPQVGGYIPDHSTYERTVYNTDDTDFDTLQKGSLDNIGNLDSLIEEYSSMDASIDLIVPNMLPSISMESVCIENLEGKRITNEGEDIYQFVPSKQRSGSIRKDRRRRVSSGQDRPGVESGDSGGSATKGKKFDPYTQIWMCGRDQRKGLLQIFTYNDGNPGNYVSGFKIIPNWVMVIRRGNSIKSN